MIKISALACACLLSSGCAFLTTRQQQAAADSLTTAIEAARGAQKGASANYTTPAIIDNCQAVLVVIGAEKHK